MISVFVISLLTATDRRAKIAARLAGLGVPFTFFDAIDGNSLPAHEVAAAHRLGYPPRYGTPLLASELGCTESHRQVCARIAASPEAFGCVLEDDVNLHSDVLEWLDATRLKDLPSFDVLRLHETGSSPWLAVASQGRFQLRAPYSMGCGAYAQIYTREGAAKAATGLCERRMPTDHVLFCDALIGDLRVLEVHPPLAVHPLPAHDISTIDPNGHRQRPRAAKPLFWKVRCWAFWRALRLRRLRYFVTLWGTGSLFRLQHRRK